MESNKKEEFPEITSPDVGLVWSKPMCVNCKYSKGRLCLFYNEVKTEAGVDLFNCPSFVESEKSEEKKAFEMMGVK